MTAKGWRDYVCEKGHGILIPPDRTPLTECEAYILGKRCGAPLTQIGRGSKGPYKKKGKNA